MSFKKNVIANYLGQGWTALMSIAFIPLYIKFLGIEAYGLIGVFAILQAWMTTLDMSITPTLNREIARYKAGAINVKTILDLLRTIEWICVVLALLIVSSIYYVAPLLADSWLKTNKLTNDTVTQALIAMGFVLAARLWEEVYRGAIRGMQQQVWLNVAQSVLATLRWAGVLLVLACISSSLQAFFIWQGIVSLISIIVYARKTYYWLPDASGSGQFSLDAIKNVRHFAGGMLIITLLALLLTQVDKLLLTGLLPLDQFGYYTIAGVVAGGLLQLITPINAAIYPKFTELVTLRDEENLIKKYHESCQLLSAVIIPPALVIAAFAKPALFIWTGDEVLSNEVSPILSVLVIGTLLNGFMNIPYMLQLAHGWTSYAIKVNLVAVAVIVPGILWAVPRYGTIGAAWVWLALNIGYVLIGIQFMYRRLLTEQKWRWYLDSISKPMAVGVSVTITMALILPESNSRLFNAILLLFVTSLVCLAVLTILPNIRRRLTKLIFLRNT